MDTGGKAYYMGGLKQFEEYTIKYYGITAPTDAELESQIAAENLQAYKEELLAMQQQSYKPPVRVCLTNAQSPVCYHLASQLASGNVLGAGQKIALHLYNTEPSSVCEGLAMELQDLASPLLEYVTYTTHLENAFDNIHLLYILDYPYTPKKLDRDVSAEIVRAATLFQDYAKTLDKVADKNVRVILSGAYANTGATVMAASATSLKSSSFVAAPCLAESQAKALIANRLKLNSSNVEQVVIWGRTHGSVLADLTFVRVRHFPGAVMGPDPFDLPLTRCEFDVEWLLEEFPRSVLVRHGQLEGYGVDGPALAEAQGLARLGQQWMLGHDQWHSVGLISEGDKYDIPRGVTCSVPCQCKDGQWHVIANLELDQLMKVRMCTSHSHLPYMTIVQIFSRTNWQLKYRSSSLNWMLSNLSYRIMRLQFKN